MKGALSLVVGTAAGQIITLAVTPILARLYAPADFGYVALVVSTSSIITPAAALRLESALMLPKSRRDATALLTAGAVSSLVLSALTAGVLQLIFALGGLTNLAALPWLSAWVALISFLTAVFTLLSQYALREHAYGAVARRSFYQAALSAGAQLGLGFVAPSNVALAGGYALGRVAGIVPLTRRLKREIEPFSFADIKRLASEYWRFVALFTPAALLNAAGLVLPLIFVGAWFSVTAAGHWSMAERLVAAPLVLIATSVGQVVEAHLASMRRTGVHGMERYYIRVSMLLVGISAALVLLVVSISPWAIPVLLGKGWDDTADLMIAFTPLLATRLIASPMSKALVVTQRGRSNLALDIARIVLIGIVVFLIVHFSLGLVQAAWCVSLALSVIYVVTWVAGWHAVRHGAGEFTTQTGP